MSIKLQFKAAVRLHKTDSTCGPTLGLKFGTDQALLTMNIANKNLLGWHVTSPDSLRNTKVVFEDLQLPAKGSRNAICCKEYQNR